MSNSNIPQFRPKNQDSKPRFQTMARLAIPQDDDVVPDLSLRHRSPKKPQTRSSPTKTKPKPASLDTNTEAVQEETSPKKRTMRKLGPSQPSVFSTESTILSLGGEDHVSYDEAQIPRPPQRPPLKITHVNSLLLPLSKVALGEKLPEKLKVDVRESPRRAARRVIDYSRFERWEGRDEGKILDELDEEDEDTDLSGFVVSDSYESDEDEEEEIMQKGRGRKDAGKIRKKCDVRKVEDELEDSLKALGLKEKEMDVIDLSSPPKLQPNNKACTNEKENRSQRIASTSSSLNLDDDPFADSTSSLRLYIKSNSTSLIIIANFSSTALQQLLPNLPPSPPLPSASSLHPAAPQNPASNPPPKQKRLSHTLPTAPASTPSGPKKS
jgi:hypothetical protein